MKDFSGCLQTDGYAAYDELGKDKAVVHLGCMAHARRKFDQALDNDNKRASHILTQIQKLFTSRQLQMCMLGEVQSWKIMVMVGLDVQ